MSIWCSHEEIGYDSWHPDQPPNGEVRTYAHGWSNHYPTTDVEKPASVDLSHIPAWCVPGHRDEHDEFEAVGPWLRLGIQTEDWRAVVLDETAARALAADLLAWADREHVQPKEET